MRAWRWCLFGVWLLVAGMASAQLALVEPSAMVARRLAPEERVPLDGRLDHPVWAQAPVFDRFHEKEPVHAATPRHASEVRLLFDEQALYVGVNALDPEPALIRAPLVRHDGVNRTQDFLVVYVDAVGTRQSAQFFRVNAAGSTADGMHTHADDHEDFAPDFDFDAAATRHATGWSAVLRIPFSSLRFTSAGGQAMRLMVARRVPREHFHLLMSVLLPREAPSFIAQMQQVQGVQLPQDHGFLTLRPSLTVRAVRAQGPDTNTQREEASASLDLKWRPRAELVVDATLNPDFSQVALDVPQLRGNTQFALELAEKRPFFFESSDLLRAPSGGLYTRSFTEPRAGLRGTWRGGLVSGTTLAIDDRGGGLTLVPGTYATGVAEQPASRTLALRLRGGDAQALQWGALAVQRRYESQAGLDLGTNAVAGPDLNWQINEAWRAGAQWLAASTSAQVHTDARGVDVLQRGPVQRGQRRYLNLVRQVEGMQSKLRLDDLDPGFRHDSGFVYQNGVRSLELEHGIGWFNLAPFNEFWFNLFAYEARQRGSGALQSRYLTPGVWMNGASNLEVDLQWRGYSVQRTGPTAPPLHERYARLYMAYSPGERVALTEVTLNLGRMADLGAAPAGRVRHGGRLQWSARLRPWAALELEPSTTLAWFREAGVTVYDETASQLLGVWHFNARHSLRAIAQRASLVRDAQRLQADGSLSLTYAWRPTSGTVLYLGASRSRRGEAVQRERELFVKWQMDLGDWRQGLIRW